ncbi:uncharacterized protein LOC143273245 isoform X2 [Peromyscus maniculatus bairdii]|uniref:uncharacterized protein LOC143273245 isoform X2 n=1 Tax=Peromyscus maniculatus bairdii TaxID=230844 RepID=UPI003FD5710D
MRPTDSDLQQSLTTDLTGSSVSANRKRSQEKKRQSNLLSGFKNLPSFSWLSTDVVTYTKTPKIYSAIFKTIICYWLAWWFNPLIPALRRKKQVISVTLKPTWSTWRK